jgi:ribonuclease-3
MIKYFLLTQRIGYEFKDFSLLEEALTHPSCLGLGELSAEKSYERLEFLGDAILTFIITEFLLRNFPEEKEGQLTKRRSALVNKDTIVLVGKEIEILNHLVMPAMEELNESESNKIIEDLTEALIGAMYLDGGMKNCEEFVIKHWKNYLSRDISPEDDAKTYLQEWSQKRKFGIPKYKLISKTGEAHSPIFTVQVQVSDLPICNGSSNSKKIAEKEAAKELIKYIKSNYNE